MEIRVSGKRNNNIGFHDLSAWIRETVDHRKVLVLSLGEVQITMYPYDNNCVRELGKKLQELTDF